MRASPSAFLSTALCAHTDAGFLLRHSLEDRAGLCHGGPRSRGRRSARCRRGDEDRAFFPPSFLSDPSSSPLTFFSAYRSTFFARPKLAKWRRSLSKKATWSRKERYSSRSWRRKREQTRPKRRPRTSKTSIQITTALHGWKDPSSSCTSVSASILRASLSSRFPRHHFESARCRVPSGVSLLVCHRGREARESQTSRRRLRAAMRF